MAEADHLCCGSSAAIQSVCGCLLQYYQVYHCAHPLFKDIAFSKSALPLQSSTRSGEALQNKLAAKKSELAAKEGELQSLRLLAASQAQQLVRQADVVEGGGGEHVKKRARVAGDGRSPLAEDEILDTVFSCVGIGDYIFTGAVSRRWRGRYTKLCHNKAKEGRKDKLVTAHNSALFTAARLQLALRSSLTVSALQKNDKLPEYIVTQSLEPIPVLTLARVHGLQWVIDLTTFSAFKGKLQLLQWLHECGCPWDEKVACINATRRGHIGILIWVQQVTAPWSAALKSEMLFDAGWGISCL
eukprot:5383-Heterococcus_DN1.PRE.2